MFLKEEYNNHPHLIYQLATLFYLSEIEFIDDIIKFSLRESKIEEFAIRTTLDIITYGITTNKILISNGKVVYDKSNYKTLLNIVEKNYHNFIDINNPQYPYLYQIEYTGYWQEKLKKIGLG